MLDSALFGYNPKNWTRYSDLPGFAPSCLQFNNVMCILALKLKDGTEDIADVSITARCPQEIDDEDILMEVVGYYIYLYQQAVAKDRYNLLMGGEHYPSAIYTTDYGSPVVVNTSMIASVRLLSVHEANTKTDELLVQRYGGR